MGCRFEYARSNWQLYYNWSRLLWIKCIGQWSPGLLSKTCCLLKYHCRIFCGMFFNVDLKYVNGLSDGWFSMANDFSIYQSMEINLSPQTKGSLLGLESESTCYLVSQAVGVLRLLFGRSCHLHWTSKCRKWFCVKFWYWVGHAPQHLSYRSKKGLLMTYQNPQR